MLAAGRDKLLDAGADLPAVQCNAEPLPFPSRRFDFVWIAFGLRNMTRKDVALAEMRRVLRPGGAAAGARVFARVASRSRRLRLVRFNVLPRLGKLVAGDAASYRYLAESIRMHPDQEDAQADHGAGGIGACGLLQPCGRRGRAAPGVQALSKFTNR